MIDVKQVKGEAVTRVLARRRTPRIRVYNHPETGEQVRAEDRVTGGGDELLPASDLDQWLDDRIARLQGGGPVTEVLATVLSAARAGEGAACAAVGVAAGRLGPWEQFWAWTALAELPAQLPAALRLMNSVRAEWGRLKLQAVPPDAWATPFPRGPRIGPPLDAPAGGAYSPGVPDSMKPPWART